MTRLSHARISALGLGVALAVLAGCDSGPKRYPVSGTVKYKGEPVKAGTINFRGDSGDSGSANITDGRYEIPSATGLSPGNYKVAITYPDPKAPQPKGGDGLPGETVVAKELLPPKYNNQTELTAEVKAQQSNDVSFDLK